MTPPDIRIVKFTAAKAWAAAIGGTATATATAVGSAAVLFEDDAFSLAELGTAAGIIALLVATVRAVWQVENRPERKQL